MKTFIIEQSPMIRKMVTKVLSGKFGSESVLETTRYIDAITFLEKNAVDLIICSHEIEGVRGEEIYNIVTTKEKNKDTPFLMLSNDDSCPLNITCVRKPVSPYELEDAIRKAINIENKRTSNRIYLCTPLNVSLILNDITINAKIVNISKTGALLKLIYIKDLYLYEDYQFILQEFNAPLFALIVRIQAVDISSKKGECLVGIHFLLDKIEANNKENFEYFIDKYEREYLCVE